MAKLRQDEYMEEFETAKEIVDLKAALKACAIHTEFNNQGYFTAGTAKRFRDVQKDARKAKSHLENAKAHESRFEALAVMIKGELEKLRAQGGMIRDAGRVIGTAEFIKHHISSYIHLLDGIIEEKHPKGFKVKSPQVRTRAWDTMHYIETQLKTDIGYLIRALKAEKNIEKETPKEA